MNIPNFFIVGAPKCGTTAMNDFLGQHPDIFMAKKELHYFGEDLQLKHLISRVDYLQCFAKAQGNKIIGEASVWYLYSTTAAKEIKLFSPGAKILIMLRNPVEVLYSLHSQHLYEGNEDVADFKEAIELDEERKKGLKQPNAVDFFTLPLYKESVLYSQQVKRYIDLFGKDNIHIIIYDDFVANIKKVLRQTFQFLGVDPDFAVATKFINANKKIGSFYLHRVLKMPSLKLKKAVRFFLPAKWLRHQLMKLAFTLNISRRKRAEMEIGLKEKLKAEMKDDIFLLEKIVQRDLSGWIK